TMWAVATTTGSPLLVHAAGEESAVYDEYLTGHETGGVGCEEDCGARKLLELSEPAHRRPREEFASAIRPVQKILIEWRPEYPRRDRVHTDAVRRPFDGERLGQRSDSSLAGAIGRDFVQGHERRQRRDVDDTSVLSLDHVTPEHLRGPERAREIGVE